MFEQLEMTMVESLSKRSQASSELNQERQPMKTLPMPGCNLQAKPSAPKRFDVVEPFRLIAALVSAPRLAALLDVLESSLLGVRLQEKKGFRSLRVGRVQ